MTLQAANRMLETDEEGYLLDPGQWDRDVAAVIAKTEGIVMTDHHWLVVDFVRRYYEERMAVPEARTLLKYIKETLGEDKATRKFVYQLFPYGYGQQACKIAGMRKPKKLMLDV